jgi:serine/threonine protein kinase
MWGHRIYRFVKDIGGADQEYITFQHFLCGLRCLCRSEDSELDSYIFTMFDLSENKELLSKQDLVNIIINMPDIGFSSSQNVNAPDKFYQNIKNSVIYSVQMRSQNQQQQQDHQQKQVDEQRETSFIKQPAT